MSENTENEKINHTEARILAVAEKEFMEKGFAGARTIKIAEEAGVTHAMLHYYFRTKEKLFEKIISEKVELLRRAVFASVTETDLPLKETLKMIIGSHLDLLARNPGLPRFLMGEFYSNSDRGASILARVRQYAPLFIERLQKKIDEESEQGLCRRIDAPGLLLDIASLNIFSFMAAPVVSTIIGDLAEDMEKFIEKRKIDNYDTIMRKLAP